jgi:hypothetical protein
MMDAFFVMIFAAVVGWFIVHALATRSMQRWKSPSLALAIGILVGPACLVVAAMLAAPLIPEQDWQGGAATAMFVWVTCGGAFSAIVGCAISAFVVAGRPGYRANDDYERED